MYGLTVKTLAIVSGCVSIAVLSGIFTIPGFSPSLDRIENCLSESSRSMENKQTTPEEDLITRAFRKAEVFEIEGKHDLALATYQDILFADYSEKTNWQATAARAHIYEHMEKYDLALNEYSSFIQGAKQGGILQALAYSYRIELYEKQGNLYHASLDKKMIAAMK